ncbi:hypothetical protein [Acetobacter fabarum]|uniref:hypothetical protein n=1 Tax=Acetobacter fabarum TaxID=483199 RepID=UPI001177A24E|nr:hypothetical protein [Acetobacter fabarum]
MYEGLNVINGERETRKKSNRIKGRERMETRVNLRQGGDKGGKRKEGRRKGMGKNGRNDREKRGGRGKKKEKERKDKSQRLTGKIKIENERL